jgi:hypothetical protein
MSWTHSGIFLEKRKDLTKVIVYCSENVELDIFADEHGFLKDFFKDQIDDVKEDGLYMAVTGYGFGFADPVIYSVKKIADIDWNMRGWENAELVHEHIDGHRSA